MAFSQKTKVIAAAIVHIFETSKPLGDYAAYAVLDDGAGVSYGINQFTHRSGSLYEVIAAYLGSGGDAGRAVFVELLPILAQKTKRAIDALAANAKFRNALKAAAATAEMRLAQQEIAFGRYMSAAIAACEGSNFVQPLTLAVVYDSTVHGSYERIRDRVTVKREQFMADGHFEKAWVAEYTARRDAWLESVPRLKKTDYRTDFFLVQIARGNWDLDLPMNVHGYKLTSKIVEGLDVHDTKDLTAEAAKATQTNPASNFPEIEDPQDTADVIPPAESSQPSNEESHNFSFAGYAGKAETAVNTAAEKFDRVNNVAGVVLNRKDSAKSLWTMIGGTLWQAKIAFITFFLGVPREIWIVVAVISGLLMLLYLYRQISLGKIRENAKAALQGVADMI
ncbi:MAG: chitosanase [Acidobacteria bacterium]|nr:chitosanase [Acidobacteriota bacterium]